MIRHEQNIGIEIVKKEGDEVNEKKIKKDFVEMPSNEIELLANNLARPDGFAKTLILGRIVTSDELQKKIGDTFVRTHRGYYWRHPSTFGEGGNDDLSFKVGKVQRIYGESSPLARAVRKGWKGGIGFTLPSKSLLTQRNTETTWGCFDLSQSLKSIQNTPLFEKQFEKYLHLSKKELYDIDIHPPKQDFLNLVNIARKANKLDERDQAEMNILPEGNILPQISLDKTIILIPKNSKKVFKRYLKTKIKEIQPFAKHIKEHFDIDITSLDAETVLQSYPNIYWYPQKNIELAVEYLSTHKQKINEILVREGSKDKTKLE